MLQIQSKRFYLDVKQNRRGKFIKVAEVSINIYNIICHSSWKSLCLNKFLIKLKQNVVVDNY